MRYSTRLHDEHDQAESLQVQQAAIGEPECGAATGMRAARRPLHVFGGLPVDVRLHAVTLLWCVGIVHCCRCGAEHCATNILPLQPHLLEAEALGSWHRHGVCS